MTVIKPASDTGFSFTRAPCDRWRRIKNLLIPERGGQLSSLKEDDRLVVEFTQLSIARSGKCHYARFCCRKSLGHSARGVRAVARNLPVRFQGAARAGGKALHDKDCDPVIAPIRQEARPSLRTVAGRASGVLTHMLVNACAKAYV